MTNMYWGTILTEKGESRDTWTEALPLMPHAALVTYLPNLVAYHVDPAQYMEALLDHVHEPPERYQLALDQLLILSEQVPVRLVITDALAECVQIAIRRGQ